MPSFEQVDFAYAAGRLVLEGFSLELPDRGVVCLVGPSGCGKTTLLRLAAGLESPHAGRISGFQGRRAAMVFQEDRLLPWETTRQNATTTPSSDRATEWLVALGLGDSLDRRPGELSGGMAPSRVRSPRRTTSCCSTNPSPGSTRTPGVAPYSASSPPRKAASHSS